MAIVEGYATLAEVKSDLRLTTTADDERIERCIEAASRLADHVSHRKWITEASVTRNFRTDGYVVWIDEAQVVNTVEESDDQVTWTAVASGWITNASAPPIRMLELITGRHWSRFVRVLGTWGSGAIPTNINQATRIEAVRLFKRPDTPEGVLVGDFGSARLAKVDPDFFALVGAAGKRKVIG